MAKLLKSTSSKKLQNTDKKTRAGEHSPTLVFFHNYKNFVS